MAQTLYMVLVDAEKPVKVKDTRIKQWFADQFGGEEVHVTVSVVLDVDDYDPDGSDAMELVDELGDLQEEIAGYKT